jgi:hypothetical protein
VLEPIITNFPELKPDEQNILPAITPNLSKIITAVEQYWWTAKKLLNTVEISKVTGIPLTEVSNLTSSETYINVLRVKGLITTNINSELLTSRQILAANMVLTRADTRSLREKLKEVGVSVSEWNGWLATKAFKTYVTARSESELASHDHAAFKTILNAVDEGDIAATKLFLELRGRYSTKVDVSVNVNVLLTQVVELIASYVSSDQLEEIATKLDSLYNNHTGQALNVAPGLTF